MVSEGWITLKALAHNAHEENTNRCSEIGNSGVAQSKEGKMNARKVALSGIRPTAGLHLGNILGAVNNMVKLQNSGIYNCYFFIADYHAATTNPDFGKNQGQRL